eukprot:10527001-Ditylum_brightwellii.AAC.1
MGGNTGASPGFGVRMKLCPVRNKYTCGNLTRLARPLNPPPRVDFSVAALQMSWFCRCSMLLYVGSPLIVLIGSCTNPALISSMDGAFIAIITSRYGSGVTG